MFKNLLTSIALTVFFSVGVLGGLALDRLPAYLTLPIPVFHPKIQLPYVSLKEQRDRAVEATRFAEESVKSCRGAIVSQNKKVSLAASLGVATLTATEQQLRLNRPHVQELRRHAAALKAYEPKGSDSCARWEDADSVVQAHLKGTHP